MQATLHILTADDGLDEMIDYVLEETTDERTLVFLSEADHYQKYVGYNRNIQVGVSYRELDINKILNYKNLIVESYDREDMLYFISNEEVTYRYLDQFNKNIYIILPIYVKVKIGAKFNCKVKKIHKKNHSFNQISIQLKK